MAGPFPVTGRLFTVRYEHALIARTNEFVFFYALGTGKYFPTYEKVTVARFDFPPPEELRMKSVWLDKTPVAPANYHVVEDHLTMTLTSQFGPLRNELIVLLQPVGQGVRIMLPCTNIVVSRPTNATGALLRWPDSLSPADFWALSSEVRVLIGNRWYVTSPVAGPGRCTVC